MTWTKRLQAPALIGLGIAVGALVYGLPDKAPTAIESIRHKGELVVAVREGPASYFTNSFGPTGFDYELARGFAQDLGVQLKVVGVETAQEGLALVASGDADIAVGQSSLDVINGIEGAQLSLSVPVHAVPQLVVCEADAERKLPANVVALASRPLSIAAGSHHASQLEQLRTHVPSLSWAEIPGSTDETLLGFVQEEQSGCALIDGTAWAFHRHLYPALQVAFELPEPARFGWAIATGKHYDSLRETANAYLARREVDGTLASLHQRHFAHLQTLSQVEGKRFYQAIRSRLPQYVGAFRKEARRNDLDWRLLAAVAYQESLWDPAATSPTGVQGIMQLTLDTALELGIDDRTDPFASIHGGARYLRQILDQLPDEIPEADRTWMALAAYNAGIAHVLDARELTRKRGGNPNAWPDVLDNLALLKQPKWYAQTRFGYARGATQAVIYVRHIRRYYDLLVLASNSNSHGAMMLAMGGPTRAAAN